mmetsp:Transcript_44222/g.106565  ORF Transcript_44222/g.106565 Transcript_44222/m.106565 type:complete len:290 (-) Transcript_44222:3273-4142(-)|eukprot:CAMPEP_0113602124 /NCGR_PEP_ID=MMETSP0017_2-20120614/587_1 /TAXON_ID=2856 /ORGANISM="Cylindrotheca closterium" /LENGTH=289 /DNA_ID=CAMNT_0000510447 /DNA_START=54 /DNA_END=923 /DNA_ORIENTATION=- /assembly_acc=CAM_ASM_000147
MEEVEPAQETDATLPVTSWHKSAWRMDPTNSYSDWKIEIDVLSSTGLVLKTDVSPISFQVHKFFLAVGPRRSLYFDSLFRSAMKECKAGKTTLTLEPSAAKAFPAFLDYIYTGDLDLDPISAVALGYLADYFGVEKVQPLVDAFIQKDIQESRANVHIYCQEAIMYKNAKLVETLMTTVATLSQDDLLRAKERMNGNRSSKYDPTPVEEMMSLLSLEQRNQVYLEALRVAHAEMARLKPVKDFFTGVFSNVAFRPELTPELFECLERGGAIRTTHGHTWMPIFYYDGRA